MSDNFQLCLKNERSHSIAKKDQRIRKDYVEDITDVKEQNDILNQSMLTKYTDPQVLAAYIQLFLNLLITITAFYFAISFILMIKNDVEIKLQQNAC